MGKNHPLKVVRFLRLLANCPGNAQIMNLKIFNDQIIADLPWIATEKISQNVRKLDFY